MNLFINAIVSATMFTLGVTIVNIFTNVNKSFIYYFFIYLVMFAASYISPFVGEILFPKVHAEEAIFYDYEEEEEYYVPNAKDEIALLEQIFRKLTPEKKKNIKIKQLII